MSVKLLTEHHWEFLSLKGGCTGSSESTLVKMSHCCKSYVVAHISTHARSLRLVWAFICNPTLCVQTVKTRAWLCGFEGSSYKWSIRHKYQKLFSSTIYRSKRIVGHQQVGVELWHKYTCFKHVYITAPKSKRHKTHFNKWMTINSCFHLHQC